MTAPTMSSILTELGLVVTEVIGMVGEVATTIMSQPLLLLGFGIAFLAAGVAFFKRLA